MDIQTKCATCTNLSVRKIGNQDLPYCIVYNSRPLTRDIPCPHYKKAENICSNCGNEYPESLDSCPFCSYSKIKDKEAPSPQKPKAMSNNKSFGQENQSQDKDSYPVGLLICVLVCYIGMGIVYCSRQQREQQRTEQQEKAKIEEYEKQERTERYRQETEERKREERERQQREDEEREEQYRREREEKQRQKQAQAEQETLRWLQGMWVYGEYYDAWGNVCAKCKLIIRDRSIILRGPGRIINGGPGIDFDDSFGNSGEILDSGPIRDIDLENGRISYGRFSYLEIDNDNHIIYYGKRGGGRYRKDSF